MLDRCGIQALFHDVVLLTEGTMLPLVTMKTSGAVPFQRDVWDTAYGFKDAVDGQALAGLTDLLPINQSC